MKTAKWIVAAALVVATLPSVAQKKKMTLAEITDFRSELLTRRLPVVHWIDEEHYAEGGMGFQRMVVDVKTGKKEPEQQQAMAGSQPGMPQGQAGRPQTPRKENWLPSPDGAWGAYTKDGNLYGEQIATGRTVQYTADGSGTILNGTPSWVYWEEILGHDARTFWWSPDGKHLAFFRTDESQVPVFPVFDVMGQHGRLNLTRYPKAGDPNPAVRIGFVSREGGQPVWADFDPAQECYFGRPFWAPDGTLWVQWMPREQNELKIFAIDPATGKKREVYAERHDTWVDWKSEINFLEKQQGFLVRNTSDGWDRIYLHGMDGTLKKCLTPGRNFWATKIVRVDEAAKTLYFTSKGEASTREDLYSVRLDGSALRRLTFGDYHHTISLSPGARYFTTRYSNVQTPERIALVEVRTGKVIRQIADSKTPEFDNYEIDRKQVVYYTTRDGLKVPAIVSLPAVIDPARKYPVIIRIYGGPDMPQVTDRWWGATSWMGYEGVISVVLDHRGSGHLGRHGLDYLHRNLGKYEIEDFVDFVKEQLYTKPCVDRSKIAIAGHSYGGYLTSLALMKAPEYFKFGDAAAGVMDWALYDSHYTERYMDTPKSNPEGYKAGSVLTYTDSYGPGQMLYIRFGMVDDNVHPQNSLQLIEKLEVKDQPFEVAVYPGLEHSFMGRTLNTTANDQVRFWYRCLLGREAPKEVLR